MNAIIIYMIHSLIFSSVQLLEILTTLVQYVFSLANDGSSKTTGLTLHALFIAL